MHRIVVAFKKKLTLFEYTQMGYQPLRELAVPDLVLSMMWFNDMICVGTKKEYSILNQVPPFSISCSNIIEFELFCSGYW